MLAERLFSILAERKIYLKVLVWDHLECSLSWWRIWAHPGRREQTHTLFCFWCSCHREPIITAECSSQELLLMGGGPSVIIPLKCVVIIYAWERPLMFICHFQHLIFHERGGNGRDMDCFCPLRGTCCFWVLLFHSQLCSIKRNETNLLLNRKTGRYFLWRLGRWQNQSWCSVVKKKQKNNNSAPCCQSQEENRAVLRSAFFDW